MIRNSVRSSRTQLGLTRLEERDVPAGLIDVVGDVGGYFSITGDNADNHIRVEVQEPFTITVSSDSGPIRYFDTQSNQYVVTESPVVLFNGYSTLLDGMIDTGNGDDRVEITGGNWSFLNVYTGKGDDAIRVQNLNLESGVIVTGQGADTVLLSDCNSSDHISNNYYNNLIVQTEKGDDQVLLQGASRFDSLLLLLGSGDDVVAGDTSDTASLTYNSFAIYGENGHDQLLNAGYFLDANAELFFIDDVEYQG